MARVTSPVRLVVVLVALLLVATALPGVAWNSYLADGQGTTRGEGVGPEIPGVAWATILSGTEQNGQDTVGGVTGMGVQLGLTTDDLALIMAVDTTGDDGGGESDRVLIAVDTADGAEAWRADDIRPECGVVQDPDGMLWAMRQTALGEDFELVTIDAGNGTVTPMFTDDTSSALDPILTACDDTPLQLSADGSQLLLVHRNFETGAVGDWLRVFDVSPFAQTNIVRLDTTDDFGDFGGYEEVVRVAPAGSPGEGSVYVFERTTGDSNVCCGEDDVNQVHALVLADLPSNANITDADVIDRTVELPVTSLWTGAIVIDDDTILVSGEEQLDERVAADGEGVNARNFAVVDDGETLEVAETSVGKELAEREAGDHVWHFQSMNAGDGDTLVGRYRGAGGGVLAGMDATTLDQAWAIEDLNCVSGTVAADAAGVSYFTDFCDEVVGAVTADGRLKWTLDYEAEHPLTDGSGTVDLGDFGSFAVRLVTSTGRVIVTADAGGDASEQGLVMLAIDLGTAVERAAGASRVETAVDISMTTFPGGADVVVLAKAGDYPDALSGAPLAVALGGPLLLTDSAVLSPAAAAEIDRLGATRAILLGGEAALSAAVEAELVGDGLDVDRIAGESRYDTARLVAERLGATTAVVVEGRNANPFRGWPDAVAASSWAASTGRAILLVEADRLPDETADALGVMTDVVVVGGTVAVSADVQSQVDAIAGDVERISGDTRYATSVAVVERSLADGNSLDVVWLATGTGFADALTAGPAAALTSGVLLLIDGGNPAGGAESLAFLEANADDVGSVFLVGGETAITPEVADAVDDALGR